MELFQNICIWPGYIWHAGLRFTKIVWVNIWDPELFLRFECAIVGGTSGSMGARYAVYEGDKVIIYKNVNILYGHRISQSLPYGDIKVEYNASLHELLTTNDKA